MISVMVIWVMRMRMGIGVASRAVAVDGLPGSGVVFVETMGIRAWFNAGIIWRGIEQMYTVVGTGRSGNGNRWDGGHQRWRGKRLARDATSGVFSLFYIFLFS